MGTETNEEIVLYCGGTKIGTLAEFDEVPTITPDEPLEIGKIGEPMEASISMNFTAERWTTCKSRKRFIKLMCGVFGVPRNEATALAKDAMAAGCPSYNTLWIDCFSYFVRQLIQWMTEHKKSEAME